MWQIRTGKLFERIQKDTETKYVHAYFHNPIFRVFFLETNWIKIIQWMIERAHKNSNASRFDPTRLLLYYSEFDKTNGPTQNVTDVIIGCLMSVYEIMFK